MNWMNKLSELYKTALIVVFKSIAIIMILGGLLLTLCIIADVVFNLGWGYPWWSVFFCILYVGLSITIYKTIPGTIKYLESRRSASIRLNGNDHEELR